MKEALSVYLTIIIEFLAELYVFCFLICRKLERRKYFALRLILSVVAVLIAGFPVSYLYTLIGGSIVGRISIYLILFALTTFLMWICFDETYMTVTFCGSLAYAAQNFSYKLFMTFWCYGVNEGFFGDWGAMFELYYRLVYYPFYALAATGIYFIILRKIIDGLSNRQYKTGMFMLSVVVLAVTIILSSAGDIYFSKLNGGAGEYFKEDVYLALRQICNYFSLICLATVMVLIKSTVRQRDLQQEVEYLQHAVRQGEWQYEMSKDIVDNINLKCHDIKYKINSILAGDHNIDSKTIDDLKESVAIYDTKTDTGNALLNVLFSEKRLYCEQNGITLSCMADGSKLSFIEDGDLYCLFGNILDNALEAVKGIAEKERRVINIVIKRKNGTLLVQEENYFDGQLTFEDGLPITTKKDKLNHGFGMKSIRMIVHKYDGALTAYVNNDVFHLNAIFALSEDDLPQTE
ncbi:MAG: sensor histidine kinase [Clostridia bacterium]|nr:sensor histidine kinase [Clostridia bacterium]